ncbi:MAG: cobyric acid synthase [Actinobacteria bacterium]|nr:cobyric acid synthase [Actinomycetota bacterium]
MAGSTGSAGSSGRVGGALLVVGATSGAGKSTVAAALCRAWSRQGRSVAPFKAQNMSNHSAVTPDGGEIGRAQALQALAAGVETDRRMNPVLLKPTRGGSSHLVVLGDEAATTDARSYGDTARELRGMVLDALTGLRHEHDWVVAEGAGGAAEINLLPRDLVNLPLAAAAGIPALLVVDIDRGGAFAAAHGTLDLLPQRLRRQVVGIVFNQFRGDPTLLADGIAELTRRDGVPVLGVLPHLGEHPMLGVEDSLDLPATTSAGHAGSPRPVRVAVIRLPHLANPADLDPLVLEPDVELRWVSGPGGLEDADLVVIPGSRATVADLTWLRERGLDRALRHTRASVLGLCAGYQMLGEWIHDDLESGQGAVAGLGLLPVTTTFRAPKVVTRSTGSSVGPEGTEHPVTGYQIRWGRPDGGQRPWLQLDQGGPGPDDCGPGPAGPGPEGGSGQEGQSSPDGRVRGTSLHGVLDADGFRAALLGEVAATRARCFTPTARGYADALQDHVEHLADWLEGHVDLERLSALAATAAAPDERPGW